MRHPSQPNPTIVTGTDGDMRFCIATDLGPRSAVQRVGSLHLGPACLGAARHVFVVARGVGGQAAGVVGVDLLIEGLAREYPSVRRLLPNAVEAMEVSVHRVDEDFKALIRTHPGMAGTGTFFVALAVEEGRASVAHAGSLRAYRLARDFEQLTRDHSVLQRCRDQGILLNSQQVEQYQRVSMRGVGLEAQTKVDRNGDRLFSAANGLFVLCSEGLHTLIPDSAIELALRVHAPEQAARSLLALAYDLGASDNIALAIISCRESEPNRFDEYARECEQLRRTNGRPVGR